MIDLKQFTSRAVIDWITIGVLLNCNTQFQWLQRELKSVIGRAPYVENIFGDKNASSNGFDIRFQEPEISIVLKAMAAIHAKFGLGLDPIVRSVEISVDFTPKTPNDLARARMARVLMNHLQVNEDVISKVRDRPRTVWGREEGKTNRLLYDSQPLNSEENKRFLIETDWDRAPYTDGTLEVGEKNALVTWRVMDKILDRQNIAAGTFISLDDISKRVRIEVTLDRPKVKALGITYLDDLRGLNFTRLQGRYFQFMLPTFINYASQKTGKRKAIAAASNPERASKFFKTGVIGLKAMDEVRAERWLQMRRTILPDIHERGLRLSPIDRTAKGVAGTFVAYDELNDRVRIALRNLGSRVGADFLSGA
ncbi:MAG: hypothetical protein WA950_22475 [Shinella sp.]|uniref:hypothetical protein n=1 Tax=Shinella sp. TaxID=1870904 RepID=UPI003C7295F8